MSSSGDRSGVQKANGLFRFPLNIGANLPNEEDL